MGNLKKKRRLKMNKHKRRKRTREPIVTKREIGNPSGVFLLLHLSTFLTPIVFM